jgi:hypothetical protein
MDVLVVLASGMTGSGGGLNQGHLQFLEFYGCPESICRLIALLVTVIIALDISPDGDDTKKVFHAVSKSATSNYRFLPHKFSWVPKVMGRVI